MAGNLTRDEARARAALITVDSYEVVLDLTDLAECFESSTTVQFGCAETGARTFIDLVATDLRSVSLNGVEIPVSAYDPVTGRLPLTGLAEHNELRVDAVCTYRRDSCGMHRYADPDDGQTYVYTKLEPAHARRVYACFDQPDLKATFAFTVVAPTTWEVISNSSLAAEPAPVGEGPPRSKSWRFLPTPRLPTYVTAVVAGPFQSVLSSHDGVPLGIYCRPALASNLDHHEIFEITTRGLDFFQQLFGARYPFTKYDQLFVPEFSAGGMENAGCVTLKEDYLFRSRVTGSQRERRAATILHELAHMWFGDLVTMRWWDDLWLNESFATFASFLCLSEATRWRDSAWTTFANSEKVWAYRQDQLPSTHPIAADVVDLHAAAVNFDGITYAKGASVLKQLRAILGADPFAAGLQHYVAQHAHRNTTLPDLLDALSTASGRDLVAWSKEWLETASVNTLRPVFTVASAGNFDTFGVSQESPADHRTLRTHRVAIGLYDRDGDRLVRRRRVELEVAGTYTPASALLGERRPDLLLLNDDDLTYAKIRFDERSLATLLRGGITALAAPLPRALCWAALWDMTRDADLAAREYVGLTCAEASEIDDDTVLQTVLVHARLALHHCADPAWRPTGLSLLEEALLRMLHQAEPASDRQLCLVNALAAVAHSAPAQQLLRRILDGTSIPTGLTVDTDLRWTLLQGLVASGVAGLSEIAVAERADPTSKGEQRAATCRASIPDPAAKQRAWDILTDEAGIALTRATVAGFLEPRTAPTLAPFVEQYFAHVGRIWESWQRDKAHTFVVGCYPGLSISPETVRCTERYLSEQSPPPALRRLLIEGADGVERALRAQARDRAAATHVRLAPGPRSG